MVYSVCLCTSKLQVTAIYYSARFNTLRSKKMFYYTFLMNVGSMYKHIFGVVTTEEKHVDFVVTSMAIQMMTSTPNLG